MTVNLTTHVSGLASGMDTESIVNGLMKVNRVPLDKLKQAKTLNGWKTDAYRDVNTKIASFRDAFQDLRLQGTFNAQKVSSSDTSKVDVSMSGISTQSKFTISESVLAVPAKGGSVSFNTGISKGSDLVDPANTATADLTFSLNGVSVTIPKTSTFDQAVSSINALSDQTHVKVSNVGGSLVFNTTSTGAGQSITISGSSSDAQNLLKITDGTTSATAGTTFAAGTFTDGANTVPGYAVINGTKININDNTFTYDGVQFNLKQAIPANSSVSVSTAADTDKIFDKIKNFVDQYNTLIKDLNDKISETKDRNYPPLTDDQKKDMKDADITNWENKAKQGLLSNDSTISNFLVKLRNSISEKVQGVNPSFDTLQEIGISPSNNYKDHGKLVLDESKLKSLLTSNLSDVQKVFSTRFDTSNYADTTVTNPEKYNKSGVGVRVYDQINDTLSKLKVIAGSPGVISYSSNLAKESLSLDDRISTMQDRLNTEEQSLWTKFNAMESSIQKLNSQSSWLQQNMG